MIKNNISLSVLKEKEGFNSSLLSFSILSQTKLSNFVSENGKRKRDRKEVTSGFSTGRSNPKWIQFRSNMGIDNRGGSRGSPSEILFCKNCGKYRAFVKRENGFVCVGCGSIIKLEVKK